MKQKTSWISASICAALCCLPVLAQAESNAEPEVYSNTIKWSTASEVDNFGFDVFRGDSEDGPFECLTEEPIEGAGTIDEPQRYQFVDDTIDPTRAYYYYVESISMSGVRERFTPVIRAKPKLPETSKEEDGGAEGSSSSKN